MASRSRFVSGDAKVRIYNASQAYPFSQGDALYKHPADGTVRAAIDMNPEVGEAGAQLAFAGDFVGVAMQKSGLQPGELAPGMLDSNFEPQVKVATGGVWEFDCPSQVWSEDAGVGIAADVHGTIGDSQTVDALAGAATLSQRIGVVAANTATAAAILAGTPVVRIQVEIQPSLQRGGIPTAGTYTGVSGV